MIIPFASKPFISTNAFLLVIASLLGGFTINGFQIIFLPLLLLFLINFYSKVKVLHGSLLFFLISCFIFYLLSISYLWSHSLLGYYQLFQILALFLLSLFSIVFFSRGLININYFILIFSIAGSIYAVIILFTYSEFRGEIPWSGPNVVTRILFISWMALAFLTRNNKIIISYLLATFFVLAILVVGSRGGVIAALLTLAFMFLFNFNFNLYGFLKRNILPLLFFTGLFSYILIFYVYDVIETRFIKLLVERIHYAGRDYIYSNSLDLISEMPWYGYGLGGYFNFASQTGFGSHPHNLFIQLILDLGVFSLVPIAFILYYQFRLAINFRTEAKFLFAVPFYMLIVQQASGDYLDFRFYFIFSIVAFIAHRHLISERL